MYTLYLVIDRLVNLYVIILVVYCLMSWIPRSSGGFIEDLRGILATISEPFLGLFKRFIPPVGMVDFSPIVAILALEALLMLLRAILI